MRWVAWSFFSGRPKAFFSNLSLEYNTFLCTRLPRWVVVGRVLTLTNDVPIIFISLPVLLVIIISSYRPITISNHHNTGLYYVSSQVTYKTRLFIDYFTIASMHRSKYPHQVKNLTHFQHSQFAYHQWCAGICLLCHASLYAPSLALLVAQPSHESCAHNGTCQSI